MGQNFYLNNEDKSSYIIWRMVTFTCFLIRETFFFVLYLRRIAIVKYKIIKNTNGMMKDKQAA